MSAQRQPLRVLVVADTCPGGTEALTGLQELPELQVLACVRHGAAALRAVVRQRPEIVAVGACGRQAAATVRLVMENCPTPIVVLDPDPDMAGAPAQACLAAGALRIVAAPRWTAGQPSGESLREIARALQLMSEVRVVRRWPAAQGSPVPTAAPVPQPLPAKAIPVPRGVRVVAIGASTGGPPVLAKLLALLPPGLPVPLLIVQHMAPGFVGGFADWLARASGYPVEVAQEGADALPGRAYVAPDGRHLGIDGQLRMRLSQSAPVHGMRPSVSCLFHSVLESMPRQAIGVLLTGMGRDGVDEMRQLRERGGFTIAQDAASCAVYGMPGQAMETGAASVSLTPEAIAAALWGLAESA